MGNYVINYNNGFTVNFEGTLEEAKQEAEEGIGYTQEDIIIYDEENNEASVLLWYGVPAEDGDIVTVDYGDSGFYGEWI